MVQTEQMNDSEIIELLSEYGFGKTQITEILKSLPSREFEDVVNYIEKIRKESEESLEDDRKKALQELSKRKDMQKAEDERNKQYLESLKKKIAANRQEQKQKEEQENKLLSVGEKPIIIDSEVRIRAYLESGEEIYLGFANESTMKNLFEKIGSEIGCTNFEIRRFGHEDPVPISNKSIIEEFKSKAAMIEITRIK